MIENNCYFQILDMGLNESMEIIIEVVNNRTENRLYDLYLHTLIFSNSKNVESYSSFKRRLLKKSHSIKKMTEDEKAKIIETNNSILKNINKKGCE